MKFSNYLRWYREANEYTITELSKLTGITKSSLSRYETDSMDIPLSVVIKLGNLFGIEFINKYFTEVISNNTVKEKSTEKEFLTKFIQLSKKKQNLVLQIIDEFLKNND